MKNKYWYVYMQMLRANFFKLTNKEKKTKNKYLNNT